MQDSIFTKIIKGEIPSHKIYEDEHTYAFLDIFPSCEGHTLVIHKNPAEFVWDLDDEHYAQLMNTVKKIAKHYQAVSGKRYVSIDIVGTDVPHNHVHVKPFDTSEELHNPSRESTEPDHANLAVVAEKLRFS